MSPTPLQWISTREIVYGDQSFDVSEFEIDGVAFELSPLAIRKSTSERFSLQKSVAMIEAYLALVEELEPRRVLELGIFRGGSVAFLGLLPQTETVLAVDIEDSTEGALQALIDERGLRDRIRPTFGIDQADRDALAKVLADASIDELDLVVDDASHFYDETLASFNFLFPRVRPGGVYVIEDWRWAHGRASELGDHFLPGKNTPLTRLVFELVMTCGHDQTVVADIEVEQDMVRVRRGPAELDPEHFRLSDQYDEISASLLGSWSEGIE